MDWSEVVRRRRMVRRYEPGSPVPVEVLDRLLAAALRAPSAGWAQGVELLVLRTPPDVERFWTATRDGAPDRWYEGMATAPVLVVVWTDPERYRARYAEPDKAADPREGRDPAEWPVPWWDVDAGMAGLLLLQGAVDAGLGACWFGVPPQRWEALRAAFGAPAHLRPVGVVSLGVAAPEGPSARRRVRRPVQEVVHDGSWERAWPGAGPVG